MDLRNLLEARKAVEALGSLRCDNHEFEKIAEACASLVKETTDGRCSDQFCESLDIVTDNPEERLRRLVEMAWVHPTVRLRILRQVPGILSALGIRSGVGSSLDTPDPSVAFFESIFPTDGMGNSDQDLWQIELNIRKSLKHQAESLMKDEDLHGFSYEEVLERRMEERADRWMVMAGNHLLEEGSILDLGGGDGRVSRRMKRFKRPVTIADVIDWRKEDVKANDNIGWISIDGSDNQIEADDKAFDQVAIFTVCHHSEDPQSLMEEAFRVAKKRVILMESVTNDAEEYLYGAFIDWFYNRVVHYSEDPEKKIPVPCRFAAPEWWAYEGFKISGKAPSVSQRFDVVQFLNPEHHHLLVWNLES